MDAVLDLIQNLAGTVTGKDYGVELTPDPHTPCGDGSPHRLCKLLAQPSKERKKDLRRSREFDPVWGSSLIGAGATSTIFRAIQLENPRRYALLGPTDARSSRNSGSNHPRGRMVALKAVPLFRDPTVRPITARAMQKELRVLRKLQHTDLVVQQVEDAFFVSCGPTCGILFSPMEMLQVTLRTFVADSRDDHDNVREVLHGLATALVAIGPRFVHGDMHSNNVMVTWLPNGKPAARLIDFGFARFIPSEDKKTQRKLYGLDVRMLIGYLLLSEATRTATHRLLNSAFGTLLDTLEDGARWAATQVPEPKDGRRVPVWYMFYAHRIKYWAPGALDALRRGINAKTLARATRPAESVAASLDTESVSVRDTGSEDSCDEMHRRRRGGFVPRQPPGHLAVQVGPRGAKSMLERGGALMLYMKGCPHCDAIYTHGQSDTEIARLAHAMHSSGLGVTAVANGPRVAQQLDSGVWGPVHGYPTIFLTDGAGNVKRYDGARDAESMLEAYKKHIEHAQSDARPDNASVTKLKTREDIHAFMQSGNAVVALTRKDCDACNEWLPTDGSRGMLHDLAGHPRMRMNAVRVGAADGPAFYDQAPASVQSAIQSYPAFLIIENGQHLFVYDGDPRVDALVDAAAR